MAGSSNPWLSPPQFFDCNSLQNGAENFKQELIDVKFYALLKETKIIF